MAIARAAFNRTLNRIATSPRSQDQDRAANYEIYGDAFDDAYDIGIAIRNKIDLLIERHEANIAYLQSQDLLIEAQRDLFNYVFSYDYLINLIQGILTNEQLAIKTLGRNALTDKLAILVQEQTLLEDRPANTQLLSLEAKIAIMPSIIGAETLTSTRKMNLMYEMQAAASCTDNNKLIWVYRRLQQCDYDFAREPDNNCLFHFFRRHRITQTWSATLDMLKTR